VERYSPAKIGPEVIADPVSAMSRRQLVGGGTEEAAEAHF
jgi:hypothetical protein